MNISLQEELARQLEERVKSSDEFTTVEEYVHYILSEVMKQTEAPDEYTKDQEEAVKDRLESLGYLD